MTRQRRWILLGGILAIFGGSIVAIVIGLASVHNPPSLPVTAPSEAPQASRGASPSASPGVLALARSQPVRLVIPAIGVNAPVQNEYDPGGTLQTPALANSNLVGWWAGLDATHPQQSYSPGQVGPAILEGHVDNPNPAVFWSLHNLKAGNTITVTLADGKQVQFAVQHIQEVSKAAFPTSAVYGPTSVPTLRLITCGGAFDQATGHYVSSVIVYASEISVS